MVAVAVAVAVAVVVAVAVAVAALFLLLPNHHANHLWVRCLRLRYLRGVRQEPGNKSITRS